MYRVASIARSHWLYITGIINIGLAMSPLLALLNLYAMSWRATILIGHWPQPLDDDPKWIGINDAIYNFLYAITDYSFGMVTFSLFGGIAMALLLWSKYTERQKTWLVCGFIGAWLIFFLEPSGRFAWIAD